MVATTDSQQGDTTTVEVPAASAGGTAAPPDPAGRLRWQLAYYLLAAFDCATVLLCLWLTHQLLDIQADSVQVNQAWTTRLRGYLELSDLASAVNAPGNRVFETHDVESATAELTDALRRMTGRIDAARLEIEDAVPDALKPNLVRDLDNLERDVASMVASARALLERFEAGDRAGAGLEMARMDNRYYAVTRDIATLMWRIGDIQQALLVGQAEDARRLGRWEPVIGVMVLVTLIGASLYGRRLASRIREDHEVLQAARRAAEAAHQSKTSFLANIGHEMRTPLNGVIGIASLLAETAVDARQRRLVAMIQHSGEQLLHLVDDVLDKAQIDAGGLALDAVEFDLGELLHEACVPLASRARDKGLSLDLLVRPEVARPALGDAARLRQVIANLVGNAIKFTEHGGVTVRARDGSAAGRVVIEVRDTGIGMNASVLDRIFDAFVQGDGSSSRRFGGSGLGLTISRDLVELMGGRLEVQSWPGRGSIFSFEIPLPMPVVDDASEGGGTASASSTATREADVETPGAAGPRAAAG
ncbi:MAG: hypothetical protein H6983_03135 [Ectothiorhodospiraceae bacterium]|nr:hypothetical protein [Ectothiorhodospiraceae bacterium]